MPAVPEEKEGFQPGDVVLMAFLHLDTARRCRRLDGRYKSIFGRPRPEKHFVVVVDAKKRPMLVLGEVPRSRADAGRAFLVLKMTSQECHANEEGYLQVGKTPDGKPSLVKIAEPWPLPEALVVKDLGASVDPMTLRAIRLRVRSSLGYLPPAEGRGEGR